jgi:hypothetical protein
VTTALEELERQARQATACGDPMAPILRALAETTTITDRLLGELSHKLEQSREPLSPQIVRQVVGQVMRSAIPDVARALNRRTVFAAAGTVIVLMSGAFMAGYATRGDRQMVAGLRAGDETCRTENGGTLCYIPVWKTLPASTVGN